MLGSKLSEVDNYSQFIISPSYSLLPRLYFHLNGHKTRISGYSYRMQVEIRTKVILSCFMYHTNTEITDKTDSHFPSIVEQSSQHLFSKYQVPQKTDLKHTSKL